MKVFWLVIVFLTGCANIREFFKTDEYQNEIAALFVANPYPKWVGLSFKNKYRPCNAVFVAPHLAVTSSACFSSEKEGVSVYDLNTTILENKNRRFTIENIFFVEEAHLVFFYTKEESKPVYFVQRESLYGEQLRLSGFSIYGFRRFSQMEAKAMVRATRFGNRQEGEFFIVRLETDKAVNNGAALFRQNGEFAGIIITQNGDGRALAVPAEVIYHNIQGIDLL